MLLDASESVHIDIFTYRLKMHRLSNIVNQIEKGFKE